MGRHEWATRGERPGTQGNEGEELGGLTAAIFLALMMGVLAGVSVAIFVDDLGIGGVLIASFLLLAGAGLIVMGLELTPNEHSRKPHFSEEGFLSQWIAHHLPLRAARAWWAAIGLLLYGLVGFGLWHNLPTTGPSTANPLVPRPTPADVPAAGSPQKLVRGFLLAADSANGSAACGQLTPQLLKAEGGIRRCAAAVVSGAHNTSASGLSSSIAAQQARQGGYSETIVGGRAGVDIPQPGDPFEGNSLVHLVNQEGTWKIACFGYCGGLKP